MTQREWYYWHLIRNFGPLTNVELYELLWLHSTRVVHIGRTESLRLYGFLPLYCCETCRGMQLKGYLNNLKAPNVRGHQPLWEAI